MGSRLEAKSNEVRKAIEAHEFGDEKGEEYEPSKFGGFNEYFRRKKIKLQNLDAEIRSKSGDKPKIFRGIVAHVNGYTQPSLNDLHFLIVSHGGGFMQYLDGKTQVTHILASSLTPKKAVDFRKYRIVKPAWIVDSIKAGKLLPWHDYSVVDEGTGQKVLRLDNGRVSTQANAKSRGYRDQTDTSWYTEQLDARQANFSNENDDRNSLSQLPSPDVSSSINDDDLRNAFPSQDVADGEYLRSDVSPEAPTADEERPTASNGIPELQREQTRDGDSFLYTCTPQDVSDQAQHQATDRASSSEQSEFVEQEPPPDRPRQLLSVHVPLDMQDEDGNLLTSDEDEVRSHDESRDKNSLKRPMVDEGISDAKRARMTAEEHNTWLLSDPRIRKSSTLNPSFLEQYYRESRLHHLSTWKADLKSQLQAMTAEQSLSQKARQKRPPGSRRYVMHVDFDSFFVAVSLKKFPHLSDKPAVVAHGGGSGSEIASCNYPARKFGISNGMWMKKALDLCSDLSILPYDFPGYEATSKLFYEAIIATGGIVQSVSIDEALVDISALCLDAGGTDGSVVREGSVWREQDKADVIAQGLRDRVLKETGCAVSVGIGGNILLAKVALRKAKPAGQYQIKPDEILDFIGELQVQSLPGVAYSIGGRLEEAGVKLVKDIRSLTKERLISVLGPKTGERIWNYSRGIDQTEVGNQVVRKSVSAEVNWGVRFETQEQAEDFVTSLCGELEKRLQKERVRGRHLTMKIMRRAADAPLDPPKHLGHGKCDTFNKSVVLGVATHDSKIIAREAVSILRGYNFSPGELRGLGVQMTKLESLKAVETTSGSLGSQRKLDFRPVKVEELQQQEAGTPAPPPLTAAEIPSKGEKRVQFQIAPRFSNLSASQSDNENDKTTLPASQKARAFRNSSSQKDSPSKAGDAIQEDPETPRKPRNVASGPAMISSIFRNNDSPSRRPLNTLGTQFIMPTQLDPSVLAELPEDIRSRLTRESKITQSRNSVAEADNDQEFPTDDMHDPSHIDPDILAALPSSVRAEVLAQYSPTRATFRRGDQALLPQSPRKNRTVATSRKPVAAKTRGGRGGSSLLARFKGVSSSNTPTLTQSNFVARPVSRASSHDPNTTDSDGEHGLSDALSSEISEEFLAALPPAIRAEVLEEHRRNQLRQRAHLEVPKPRGRGRPPGSRNRARGFTTHDAQPQTERVIWLPADPPRPTFTSARLWRIEDLRDAVTGWVEEFHDEGPYDEDVGALERYLGSVVNEENDLDKATSVVKWLGWLCDGTVEGVQSKESARKWTDALEKMKACVNDAVKIKGLGPVDFG